MRIDNQRKTVELANGVDAGSADSGLAIFGVP